MTAVREWIPIELGYDEGSEGADSPDARPEPSRPIPRRMRRRRLLVLPLAIASLAIGAKLLSMAWIVRDGTTAYDAGEYEAGRGRFDRLRTLNVIDPWKAWFNVGDADFRLGDLEGAEAAFARALDEDPTRCDARFNLAVTIEAQGDRLMGGNVREVTEAESLEGLARYRFALDIVNSATCPMDGTDSPGYRLADTRERLEDKLGADQGLQDEAQMNDPNEDDAQEGLETDENQTLQEEIEERNDAGEAERQDASDINPTAEQQPREPNW